MNTTLPSPLAAIEPRLRWLLPASLYATVWVEPSPPALMQVFEHLRTLQRVLADYVPRHAVETLPQPGEVRYTWQEGTLMFTDLAGFTTLMERSAARGRAGAAELLELINAYFAVMIEIISKSGGQLLEFTGDAVLVLFPTRRQQNDTIQAVRAGLRMQRAMARFADIPLTDGERQSLGMRIGLHSGRFLTAHIGTPRRMEHVLLGSAVQRTKRAEGAGKVGFVCLTEPTYRRVQEQFRAEPQPPDYMLVVDDLSEDQLGEYDLAPSNRRLANTVLLDRSVAGLTVAIEETLATVEPLASYLPGSILNMLIESPARRRIPPRFPDLTAMFVNLIGLTEPVDHLQVGEEHDLVSGFSHAFALINAAVEARGGVLKNVTYHLSGSDMLIYFGVPNAHTDDPLRAAETALAIRAVVAAMSPVVIHERQVALSCQIGMARGLVFAAEIGEPRGRREFNILGDTVNIAARLMSRAEENQILITSTVYEEIAAYCACEPLGDIPLKGKAAPVPIYALNSRIEE